MNETEKIDFFSKILRSLADLQSDADPQVALYHQNEKIVRQEVCGEVLRHSTGLAKGLILAAKEGITKLLNIKIQK